MWDEEIYFPIPVSAEPEAGSLQVNPGDLGHCSTGNAFCIFFGPTPISRKGEIQPASAMTVFGKIARDSAIFRNVQNSSEITNLAKSRTKQHLVYAGLSAVLVSTSFFH